MSECKCDGGKCRLGLYLMVIAIWTHSCHTSYKVDEIYNKVITIQSTK
jgi:hypothetical protein